MSAHPRGRAHQVFWDRPVGDKDVAAEVARRRRKNRDQKIYVLDGVHGGRGDREKHAEKSYDKSFCPASGYREERFHHEDRHLASDRVSVLDVGRASHAMRARQALNDPDGLVVAAWCHGADHKYFGSRAEEVRGLRKDNEPDMRFKHNKEMAAGARASDERVRRGTCLGCGRGVYTDQSREKDENDDYWHSRCCR